MLCCSMVNDCFGWGVLCKEFNLNGCEGEYIVGDKEKISFLSYWEIIIKLGLF